MSQYDQQPRSLHLALLAQSCQELNQAVTRIEEALTPFCTWGPIWVGSCCRRLLQAVEQVKQPIHVLVERYRYASDTSAFFQQEMVRSLNEHLDEACIRIAAYQAIGVNQAMSEATLRKRVALRNYIQRDIISDLKKLLASFSPEILDQLRALMQEAVIQDEGAISQEGPHHDH